MKKTTPKPRKVRQTSKKPIVKKVRLTTIKKAVMEEELKQEDLQRQGSKQRVEKKLKEFLNPLLVQRHEQLRKELGLLRRILHRPGYGAIKISNIRHTTTDQELGAALEERGSGKIRLLNLCNSNKLDFSRNHAYVYFRVSGVAKRMAAELNNAVFLNKVVKVSFIEPQNLKADQFRKEILKRTALKK